MRNAFPSKVIDKIYNNTLSRLVNCAKKFGPEKEKIYVGLPFFGKNSNNIHRILKSIAKKFLPHKHLIIYYKPGKRVSNFFQNKDLTPLAMRSSVVYQFTCTSCHASYIGQTTRHLKHRAAEHAGVSHLTGKTLRSPPTSAIREHCCQCQNSDVSINNFKILASAESVTELLVKERLLIDVKRPSLNGNCGGVELLIT